MLTTYLVNWNDRKDASVYALKKGYKVSIEHMDGTVIQTKRFYGAYASYKANQFAARSLGLNDELAKQISLEKSSREHNAQVTKTLREMIPQHEGTEFGNNLKSALEQRERIGL